MRLFDMLFCSDDNKKNQQDYGLFSFLDDEQNNNKSNNKDNNYDLEDWQKKEVKKGNYDETAFEEDEIEDDDYYSENDE